MKMVNLMIAFAFAMTLVLAACGEDDDKKTTEPVAEMTDAGSEAEATDASTEDTAEEVAADAGVTTDTAEETEEAEEDSEESAEDAGPEESSDTE